METSLLYHEKQVASLCGVHCLNTLLQGPYFSEVDLAQIAHELDAAERGFMMEGGTESEDYLKYIAEDSGNVAVDGHFSIQVLSKALDVWGLEIIPMHSPAMAAVSDHPDAEVAFICNLQEHWFTVRAIFSDWWNFNSLFPAPQHLSSFYLSAFLGSLKEQGYTIFVVRGDLPAAQPPADASSRSDGPGVWISPVQARGATKDAANARQQGYLKAALEGAMAKASQSGTMFQLQSRHGQSTHGSSSAEDAAENDQHLARALAASLAGANAHAAASAGLTGSATGEGDWEQEDPELASAIAASLAASASASQPEPLPATQTIGTATPGAASASQTNEGEAASSRQPQGKHSRPEPDSCLSQLPKRECLQSNETGTIPPEPDAGTGVLELRLRLPSGTSIQRRFNSSDIIGSLIAYTATKHLDMTRHQICTSFPKKVLSSHEETLAAAGLTNRETLIVELRR